MHPHHRPHHRGAGILAGPLIGLALLGLAFRWVCLCAALLFAALLILQARALPACPTHNATRQRGMLADWRHVCGNRPFRLFAAAMVGSYVLNFQIYLALPIHAEQITGDQSGVAVLFTVSGLLTITAQVRLTTWATKRWSPRTAITRGLWLMAAAFLPLAATAGVGPPGPGWVNVGLHLLPVLLSTVLLTTATMIVYPFEMTTIVDLAGDRLVATHYGLYNTIAGVGIAAGNVLTGAALDTGHRPGLVWIALTATGVASAAAMALLSRRERPTAAPADAPAGPPGETHHRGAVSGRSSVPR